MTIPAPPGRGAGPDKSAFSLRSRVAYVAFGALVGVVAGVPTGWLWTVLADPPAGVLTSDGVVFGETGLNQQVGVTMWFFVTGLAAGLIVGLLLAWHGSRHGLTVVFVVLLACFLAGLVSYWTGVHIFGPDTKSQLASAKVGQRITGPMSVGTLIALLGWPIGGLVGGLLAISRWPRQRASSVVSPLTSDVVTR